MPPLDSPAIIVARYLKANHYADSYQAFINEAGLPVDAGDVAKGDLTLETLLEEKRTFDMSLQFEKVGLEKDSLGWSIPAPAIAHEVTSLPSTSNILSIGRGSTEDSQGIPQETLFVSTADRQLHALGPWTNELQWSSSLLHDSPVLSTSAVNTQSFATVSMSGQLHLHNLRAEVLEKRKDHSKYIVQIAHCVDGDQNILATAGWDNKINIYRFKSDLTPKVGEPRAVISLPTKPEAILFLRHPETSKSILLVSRADSSFLFYYTTDTEPRLLGKQNLAPHSNAWIAFTPSALAPCPTDPSLLAVATSTIPHMKLLIVRLLFPPWDTDAGAAGGGGATTSGPGVVQASLLDDGAVTETQASQARAALALADREEAALRIHCNTLAPQTAYSTPALAWRPDGCGVWVNGDDGAVRGVEAASGKVVCTLKAHAAGSKVRCLWAGQVAGPQGVEEVLVSGGFDQKLFVWKTA